MPQAMRGRPKSRPAQGTPRRRLQGPREAAPGAPALRYLSNRDGSSDRARPIALTESQRSRRAMRPTRARNCSTAGSSTGPGERSDAAGAPRFTIGHLGSSAGPLALAITSPTSHARRRAESAARGTARRQASWRVRARLEPLDLYRWARRYADRAQFRTDRHDGDHRSQGVSGRTGRRAKAARRPPGGHAHIVEPRGTDSHR